MSELITHINKTQSEKENCLVYSQGATPSDKLQKIPYSQTIKTLKSLAASGKIFMNGRQLVCDFFSQCEFYLCVKTTSENFFQITGRILIHDQDYDIKECDFVCGGSPNWFIKGIVLKMVEPDIAWKDLKQAYDGVFTRDRLQEILENKEDGKTIPRIVFEGNSYEQIRHEQKPLPLLILKDRLGAFADLWLDYGGGKRVSFEDPTKSLKRDLKEEKSFEKDLLETDFIRKDVGNSHYYCPVDKVKKSILFLLEVGWTILDWKNNKVVHGGEAELHVEERAQKILIKGKVKYDTFEADLSNVIGAFNRRENFVQIQPGLVGLFPENLSSGEFQDLLEDGEIVSEGIEINRNRIGSLQDLFASNKISSKEISEQLRSALQSFEGIKAVEPGSSFVGHLRHYQQDGLNWLSFLYTFGFNGILADDMGLGKTVQVLAFLSTLKPTAPILIVVPTSLIFNWKKEIERFLPSTSIFIFHGPDRSKQTTDFSSNPVILTSYSTLRLDLPFFEKHVFECVILDEAQAIKNHQTQAAQAVFSLNACFRLSISGTPIENHLSDLWSQFHFLMPDLLGEAAQFFGDLQLSTSDSRYLQRIKKKVKPFILRRNKEGVAKDLPEKIEQVVWVEMETEQRKIYDDFLGGIKGNLLKKVETGGVIKHRMEILEAILRLRQICCHPLLVSSQLQEGINLESSKMDALFEDLQSIVEEKKKVLVYSQFTGMLGLITKKVKEAHWSYVYLDGQTKDREKVVTQFQEDPSISLFLISLKAGGVGLNLTAADYVFLYDPWWNEAVERQAIDRAHRIGQKNTVIAKRYVMVESIEEKMMKLKAMKRTFIDEILDSEMANLNLTMDDLQFLLS